MLRPRILIIYKYRRSFRYSNYIEYVDIFKHNDEGCILCGFSLQTGSFIFTTRQIPWIPLYIMLRPGIMCGSPLQTGNAES